MKIFRLVIISSLMIGCASKHYIQTTPYKSYYALINKAYFEKMDSIKIIASRNRFILYEGLDLPTQHGNRYKRLVLETKEHKETNYYLFGEFAVYADGQIVIYSPPFFSSQESSDNNEGIWFHAEFYDENGRSGVRYKFDAEPNNFGEFDAGTEGIYVLENGQLNKICVHQTEDCFN